MVVTRTLPSNKNSARILNVNIKARRLGYIIAIAKILGTSFLFLDDMFQKLEKWAQENKRYLNQYINHSGEIEATPKHYPAKRYLEFAKNLGIIKIVYREVGMTKFGQLLLFLDSKSKNTFELTLEQICFFLKRFLITDFDCLLPILKILKEYQEPPEVFSRFKKTVLEHLKEREEFSKDIISISEFRKRTDLILSWTRERKYLEHIIYPRLNWLIDLKLIDWNKFRKKRLYELSEQGIILFDRLNKIKDDDQLIGWCNNKYYEDFFDMYQMKMQKKRMKLADFSEKQRFDYVQYFLQDAFKKFQSTGPPLPHLSASTFLEYCCVKSLSRGVIVTFQELIELLHKIPGYNFKWEAPVHDGFIIQIMR